MTEPTEAETGTTTVGLRAADGVVLATDRRASVAGGRFVTNKDAEKIHQVHPTAAVTIAGSVGGAQSLVRQLRAEVSLYESRRGTEMSVDALSTFAGNLVRGGAFRVNPVLGGVDPEGGHVFTLDGAGGVLADDYAATGSGMQLAYGVLERRYDPDHAIDEAAVVAADAVDSATERDAASGNGVCVARVTGDGVAIREYDRAEEVAG